MSRPLIAASEIGGKSLKYPDILTTFPISVIFLLWFFTNFPDTLICRENFAAKRFYHQIILLFLSQKNRNNYEWIGWTIKSVSTKSHVNCSCSKSKQCNLRLFSWKKSNVFRKCCFFMEFHFFLSKLVEKKW